MDYQEYLNMQPYQINKKEKQSVLIERLTELFCKHMENCQKYRKMIESTGFLGKEFGTLEEIPFLPVRLFKMLDLKSVPDNHIVKTLTSSGTTGQEVSKICCDKVTASNQQKVMIKIVSDFLGCNRLPMLIIDCPSVIKNREMFSARGAGILGFSVMGLDRTFALNDDMELDIECIRDFLDRHNGEKIFVFGFTFMIWQYLYKELERLEQKGIRFDFSKAVLIHGGGWKKLQSEAVDTEQFKKALNHVCGIEVKKIYDYYGMVEQTGCIYMECEYGHLHTSVFSDIIIRNPLNFNVCKFGEKGIIQVVSTIPESYPGFSLLTEDEGIILGEDDCPCGRMGKHFKVAGRVKNAEIRGCSDTYAVELS